MSMASSFRLTAVGTRCKAGVPICPGIRGAVCKTTASPDAGQTRPEQKGRKGTADADRLLTKTVYQAMKS